MIEALVSFLGGSAFRLLFGAIMDWFNKLQEHRHEMELQRLQSELEANRHEREMTRIRLQHDLGVKEIVVMADAEERKVMANSFLEAVRATGQRTGVAWVDAWNASIRPAGASISLLIWVCTMIAVGLTLTEFDRALIAAFLGIFVGDRIHTRSRA